MARRPVSKVCQLCGSPFMGDPSRKFCGKACSGASFVGRDVTWGDKLSQAMTGKRHSEESRQKMSDAHRGRRQSPEHVAKRAAARRRPAGWKDKNGYIVLNGAGHPMSNQSGAVRRARMVLFDSIGFGPHQCHWCHELFAWTDIQSDHINWERTDDRPENLRPSCGACNRHRHKERTEISDEVMTG